MQDHAHHVASATSRYSSCNLQHAIGSRGCPDSIVLFRVLEVAMILQKDVPSSAVLERQQTVPGTMGGKLPLQRHMHQFAEILRQRIEMPPWKRPRVVTVRAATGSGKSILIPTEMQKYLGLRRHGSQGKLLVLNPSTIDTANVCKAAKCTSCFRMGGNQKGGDPWGKSRVVFLTVGLAAQ